MSPPPAAMALAAGCNGTNATTNGTGPCNATANATHAASHSSSHAAVRRDLETLSLMWSGIFVCNILAKKSGASALVLHLLLGCLFVNVGLLPEDPSPFLATLSELAITVVMFSLVRHLLALRGATLHHGPRPSARTRTPPRPYLHARYP